jgi:para-nitrobenzyl esterase
MKNNYKNIHLLMALAFIIFYGQSMAQLINCSTGRYDTEIFSAVIKTADVLYGSNVNINGQNQDLFLDIYEPDGDTETARPLIVLAHGGSFMGGSRTDMDVVALCNHFAKRGYVAVSISYRIGIGFPINEANAKRAAWRATQDMKAAVRFFRKDAANNNNYKINPNIVFAGGSSAGAFMALHHAYLDKISEIPSQIDTTQLGGLEGNSGNPGYSSEVIGIINLCGALGDKNWMEAGDIPVVSLHGPNDNTVPYDTKMLYISGTFPIMVVNGSKAVHEKATEINLTNKFYTYYGQDHVPYVGTSSTAKAYMDTTVRFVSNFLYSVLGCTPSDPNPLANLPVSVEEVSLKDMVNIYPNPANSLVTLNFDEKMIGAANLSISDITGKIILTNQINSVTKNLDVKEFPKGIYFVTILTAENSYTDKLVIQ